MSKMWLTRQTFGYYTTGCLEKTRILVELSFSYRNFGEHCVKLSAPSQKSVVDGHQRRLLLLLFVACSCPVSQTDRPRYPAQ